MPKKRGVVFVACDKFFNGEVVLYKDTLKKHILPNHAEVYCVDKIKSAIENPDFVDTDDLSPAHCPAAVRYYVRVDEQEKEIFGRQSEYLIVCTKKVGHLRVVASAYFVPRIKKGKILWQKQ